MVPIGIEVCDSHLERVTSPHQVRLVVKGAVALPEEYRGPRVEVDRDHVKGAVFVDIRRRQ